MSEGLERAALADAVRGLPSGRLVEMLPPEPQAMRRIIAMRAAAAGVRISDATLASIAVRARGDVRRAMGALSRLRFEDSLAARAGLRPL